MDGAQRVWAPHPTEGYQLGLIVDLGADTLSVEPLDQPGKVGDRAREWCIRYSCCVLVERLAMNVAL